MRSRGAALTKLAPCIQLGSQAQGWLPAQQGWAAPPLAPPAAQD